MVNTQTITRPSINWTEKFSGMGKTYPCSYVWKWPIDFSGVNIANMPLVGAQPRMPTGQ
jgi:hypothetical protein